MPAIHSFQALLIPFASPLSTPDSQVEVAVGHSLVELSLVALRIGEDVRPIKSSKGEILRPKMSQI